MRSVWNERNQAELVSLLLGLAGHAPHVHNYAVDCDHPHQGTLRELAWEAPSRIQLTDPEEPHDLTRLRSAGALADAEKRAQIASGAGGQGRDGR